MTEAAVRASDARFVLRGGVAVAVGSDSTGCLVLPSHVRFGSDLVPLREFAASSFSASRLKQITIPHTVTVLRSRCFFNAKSLSEVRFESPSSLKRICAESFSGSGISAVVVPKSVEFIGRRSFAQCKSLASLTFEDGCILRRIETELFSGSSLKSFTVPKSVEFLGASAFARWAPVSCAISFAPDSALRRIGAFAFAWCAAKAIRIPRSVTFLDGSAFCGLRNVKVSIEAGGRSFVVEKNAILDFDRRVLIRSLSHAAQVTIPSHIEVLGGACFAGCSALSSVTFSPESGLRRIETMAFCESSLSVITIPKTVEILGEKCFRACAFLCSISFEPRSTLRVIESEAFCASGLRSIEISQSVTVIGPGAFSCCGSLASISFQPDCELRRIEGAAFKGTVLMAFVTPRSVEFIDGSAFLNFPKSAKISIETGSTTFYIENDTLFDYNRTTLIRYLGAASDIVVPRQVERLAVKCFYQTPLVSVSFESDSHLSVIEEKTFSDTVIRSIAVPKSVTAIDGSAFATVDGILVTIEDGNPSFCIDSGIILSSDRNVVVSYVGPSGSSLVIPKGVEVLGPSCFSGRLGGVAFEAGCLLRQIECDAFNSSSLEAIVIPRTVEVLAARSFLLAFRLASVTFEPGSALKTIEAGAFLGTRVDYMELPGEVAFIAGDAFAPTCELVMVGCAEFDEWNALWPFDESANFSRS
jgi:hypothetical protein